MDSRYLLHMHTIQSSSFRYMVEGLKEVVNDANFTCDASGVRVVSLDATRSIIVFVKLDAAKFETYVCPERVVAGVNMHSMHKLVKSVSAYDALTLWILESDPYSLHIRIENTEKNVVVESALKLLDIDQESVAIPAVKFDSIIAMPSVDLQRYCRELFIVAERVTITSRAGELLFCARGDFANQTITVRERTSGTVFVPSRTSGENSATFPLKYMNMFCKTTNLAQTVEMFLKTGMPLILVYRIGDLGKLQYALAPIEA
jgi:proliferating cell nuclear antigen